jgi:putative protein-disulfide isomerase
MPGAVSWQDVSWQDVKERRQMTAALEMIYVADPMCSWCYGFAPVIFALAQRFQARLPLRLMMGGLRAGNTELMRAADKDYVRQAWTQVGAATGQPFDMSFFERESFNYDTEPACRAVVTARRLQPKLALVFMARIQQTFYAENRDMTSAAEISLIAEQAGHARQAFAATFAAPATRNETFRDFLTAQELGIRGFSHPDRRQPRQGLRARDQRLSAARGPARAARTLAGRRGSRRGIGVRRCANG